MRQEGTSASDKMFGAAILGDDSVVITGYTEGDWAQTNAGGSDFCAVRLSADGTEVWRWQVRTRLLVGNPQHQSEECTGWFFNILSFTITMC